jgi:hypothetical protein
MSKTEKDIPADVIVQPADDEKNLHRREDHHIALADADDAAAFVAGYTEEIDPAEADRVRRKIDWHLLPLM